MEKISWSIISVKTFNQLWLVQSVNFLNTVETAFQIAMSYLLYNAAHSLSRCSVLSLTMYFIGISVDFICALASSEAGCGEKQHSILIPEMIISSSILPNNGMFFCSQLTCKASNAIRVCTIKQLLFKFSYNI